MPRKSGKRVYANEQDKKDNYARFYDRVEKEYGIDELTPARIRDWVRNETMVGQLQLTTELHNDVSSATTIKELKQIRKQTTDVLVHKEVLRNLIDEKIERIKVGELEEVIAEGIVRGQEFAETKKIVLSEKVKYNEEIWNGRKVQTIRRNGKFLAWKRL